MNVLDSLAEAGFCGMDMVSEDDDDDDIDVADEWYENGDDNDADGNYNNDLLAVRTTRKKGRLMVMMVMTSMLMLTMMNTMTVMKIR